MIGTAREAIAWLEGLDGETLVEAKKHRERRTVTQNAYYWVLVGKLAKSLGIGKYEAHRNLLFQYAPFAVVTVKSDVPHETFFKYCEQFAEGELEGVLYKHLRVYKGSSKMDTVEFGMLLDGAIFECESQGIETMARDEAFALPHV